MKGFLLVLSSIFLFSCSQKFIKNSILWPKDSVKQKILVNYKDTTNTFSNITMYTKISQSAQTAQVEAFKYNMHLFTLIIKKSNYSLTNYQENTTESGNLKNFRFFNAKFDFFKTLKKTNPQPIVLKYDNNATLSLRIIDEKPL